MGVVLGRFDGTGQLQYTVDSWLLTVGVQLLDGAINSPR